MLRHACGHGFVRSARLGQASRSCSGPQVASAQTFPQDDQWVPLTCDGQVAIDPVGDVQPPAMDVVGDAADPAAYVFMDAAWLYLRLRMSGTVLQSATTYAPDAWACLVRTAGTPGSYLVWDRRRRIGQSERRRASAECRSDIPETLRSNPADTLVATYAVATARAEAAATSQLGGNPNFFVDWAVALTTSAQGRNHAVDAGDVHLRHIETEHVLDEDVVAQQQSCGGVLDAIECVGGGCATCTTSTACGPGCVACGGATPVCDPAFG